MITQKRFNQLIGNIKRTGAKITDYVNQCILYGFDVYKKSGNADALTRTIEACDFAGGIASRHAVAFICEHANVRYVTIKNKDGVKQKVFKKREGEKHPVVTTPTQTWAEWKAENVQSQAVDAVKRLKSLKTSIDRAKESGNVTSMKEAQEVSKLLETAISKVA